MDEMTPEMAERRFSAIAPTSERDSGKLLPFTKVSGDAPVEVGYIYERVGLTPKLLLLSTNSAAADQEAVASKCAPHKMTRRDTTRNAAICLQGRNKARARGLLWPCFACLFQ